MPLSCSSRTVQESFSATNAYDGDESTIGIRTPYNHPGFQEQMAALRNESIALDAAEAKDVLLSKIQEQATQKGDHALLKVCEAKNSRELNKYNADIIRTWAKSAGLKGISRLGKAALIHKVALFRDLPDAKETVSLGQRFMTDDCHPGVHC
jgi:hypothetical protein